MTTRTHVDEVMRQAIEAAVWAPSVHNTQPWWFGTSRTGDGGRISLHADHERRLDISDPDGREMLVSCGAALYTLRLALHAYGYEPSVDLLPEPEKPGLLADLRFGRPTEAVGHLELLAGQIRRRRSHRGLFRGRVVPAQLQSALTEAARSEHAELQIVIDEDVRGSLAALTEAADRLQSLDTAFRSELARWSPAPDNHRRDGVPASAYPRHQGRAEPHFPTRRFAREQDWGAPVADDPFPRFTGTVAILTTAGDGRADWLAAGQALQRLLLRASAEDFSGALHTQALELPDLREVIRTRLCYGAYPQMIIRLGEADTPLGTVRRDPTAMTSEEP